MTEALAAVQGQRTVKFSQNGKLGDSGASETAGFMNLGSDI